jgi:hypothetical protein
VAESFIFAPEYFRSWNLVAGYARSTLRPMCVGYSVGSEIVTIWAVTHDFTIYPQIVT